MYVYLVYMYAYAEFSLCSAVNTCVQMCHMTVMYYILIGLCVWISVYVRMYDSSMQLSIALRDIADDLLHRKLRDVSDFEWQRFPRLQSHSELTVTEQQYLADQEEEEEDGRK